MKEDKAERGWKTHSSKALLEDRAGPRTQVIGREASAPFRETFLRELLNNEWTAREVASLQVFKVERQPWRRDSCFC